MSAPTPAPGDDRPREGYYPDPSIPGYVRYWNGAAWVPGTSRPAPSDGQSPGPGPSVEETGPHFFDEDPEPAPAWGADRAHQSGFGGAQDRQISWGTPDPRLPADQNDPSDPGTQVFRRPTPQQGGAQGPLGAGSAGGPGAGNGSADAWRSGGPPPATDPSGPGFGAGKAAAARAAAAQAQGGWAGAGGSSAPAAQAPAAPAGTGTGAPGVQAQGGWAGSASGASAAPGQSGRPGAGDTGAPAAQAQAQAGRSDAGAEAPALPGVPQQAGAGQAAVGTPMAAGPGGGQPSWAQRVHRLAGDEDGAVAPWKPPVEDVFQAAARRQAAARPAGLGKRLVARLLDTLVVGAVTAVAAVPLGTQAVDHVNQKIDAAKLSGRTETVWLLDGTTAAYLGIVLAVLLLFGVLYEALPTAKWGRTLGKKLCGLEVRGIESHEPPGFGGALRRWLVYSVPGVLGIGIVGVAWCLFDRPWHQCWHDKAAHTFVAG
ncbi:RDD family protein [Streptomyces sp. NPDC091280]|uniref:RDD family protein n=1 Tax=Streptomyces sp. NPDC091280 TaxID=3365984 RepID=UPI003828B892